MARQNEKPRFEALPLADGAVSELKKPEPSRPWPMSKAGLCAAYEISQSTLIRWIRPFLDELKAAGYGIWQKRLTRRQVRIIFEKLDPPEGYTIM